MRLPRCVAWAVLSTALFASSKTTKPSPRGSRPRPVNPEAAQQATARRWLRSLSLNDRAAQMVVMPCFAETVTLRSKAYREYRHEIRDVHIGGLVVLGRVINGAVQPADPRTMAGFLNRMQRLSRLPLLVGADFERGPSNRVKDSAPWPYNMAFGAAGDVEDARYEGAATAREARALGVQWILAPDADVNNNPANPIINMRSYGENPVQVSRFVRAYIEGAHSDSKNRVLVTAKHFPGHGNTAEDSHLGLARNDETRIELDQIDLVPFREAIGAGTDAIMAAHISVPALEPDPVPATVSPAILTGLLRDEMKFSGLIVTDAMDMQGLAKMFDPEEAAVRAVMAGADILLMPHNAEDAVEALVRAVRAGRISRARLDESVMRILAAKARAGLGRSREVSLARLPAALNAPEDRTRAQAVADRAITLVRNVPGLIPLPAMETACVLVLAESNNGSEGPHLIGEIRKRAPKMQVQLLDPSMSSQDLEKAKDSFTGCSLYVASVYSTKSGYANDRLLAGDFPQFLNNLLGGKTPVVVIGLGSPYFARAFPGIRCYLATFSTAESSEDSAAKALFGEIAIGGKLPVTIPGFAARGDGVAVPSERKIDLGEMK